MTKGKNKTKENSKLILKSSSPPKVKNKGLSKIEDASKSSQFLNFIPSKTISIPVNN